MKLSWKLFFITTPIFILFLTVFGSWMIQTNIQNSLSREMERCMVENQMLQNSYELTWHGLSEEQQEMITMDRLVESFYQKYGQSDSRLKIYDKTGKVLYQDGNLQIAHTLWQYLDEENNVVQELIRQEDETYMIVLARLGTGEYMETSRNISQVFQERSDMYRTYQAGILLLAILMGGVILTVLFFVMRNMQKLSSATRQYAGGRYQVRVNIRSQDEIGALAQDFNWMANAMNQQMEKLQEEVKRKEEFTAAFAHELKTPLTSIIGYADTIRQMDLSKEETDMCADYIFHQGKRLQSLSYKLLEMTMAGKREIDRKEIQVPEFMKEVTAVCGRSLAENQLKLHINIQEGVLNGDRELLSSVFINLIDNARKASEPGQRIWLKGEAVSGGYRLIVQDEGKGVSPEELAKISEPFYMTDKSRARKEGGAGLGLALCKKILELHQAGWIMESEPGKGMKITVLFGECNSEKQRNKCQRICF